jgi:hypothetical protein
MVSDTEAASQARLYSNEQGGRAIAVAPNRKASWRMVGWPNDSMAETAALEGCQVFANEPCVLVASGDHVLPKDEKGPWQRPSSRVAYAGEFDPKLIPIISPARRDAAEAGYRRVVGAKAMALHPWGRIFVGTGEDQAAAETAALKLCNEDPDRKGAGGPCFLYAVGDQVVLPARRTSPEPRVTLPVSALERIALVANSVSANAANRLRREYGSLRSHKAIALHVASGQAFTWSAAFSAGMAEQWALEGCQLEHNSPCILLAVDDELRAPEPKLAPARSMERITYQGPLRWDMLPWDLLDRPAIANYRNLPEAKAIAIRPNKAEALVASGKASQAEAERSALSECNGEEKSSLPCFIYASGMQVILPARRTEAPR